MIAADALKEFKLFADLDSSKLAAIAEFCHTRSFKDSTTCFSQGNKSSELHLLRNGKIDILMRVHEPWGIELKVHTANPGEVFGWSALVEPYLYTASAKCVGDVEEIYIKGADLEKLFKKDPAMGYTIMRNLSALISSRLTESREKLTKEIASSLNKEW
jgi:CRP-like cAMP-binding protein